MAGLGAACWQRGDDGAGQHRESLTARRGSVLTEALSTRTRRRQRPETRKEDGAWAKKAGGGRRACTRRTTSVHNLLASMEEGVAGGTSLKCRTPERK
jgi:hypothetical protein